MNIGKKGEEEFKRICKENDIKIIDLRKNKVSKVKNISCINSLGKKEFYTYKKKSNTHPFDFIINNKNLELKTSQIGLKNNKKKVSFNFSKNSLDKIDFIIGIIFGKEKYCIFDKDTFIRKTGIMIFIETNKKYKIINKDELIIFLRKL